jgi:hypothetical protein
MIIVIHIKNKKVVELAKFSVGNITTAEKKFRKLARSVAPIDDDHLDKCISEGYFEHNDDEIYLTWQ